jgi:FkbM family methyltransferase
MSCFNNCNPKTNGEQRYISLLSPGKVIFDVGSRNDSDFMSYNGEVHYFDPVERFVNELKDKPTRNTK